SSGIRDEQIDNVERFYGSAHADEVSGTALGDDLRGYDGNDRLNGGDGSDTLTGGEGNDQLIGGSGADELDGGAGNDYLDGGDDDDTLEGGAGNDNVSGGSGSDTYIFNPFDGNDTFNGGEGGGWTDTVQLNASADPGADPDNPWTIAIDGEQVQYDLAAQALELNPDTSGVITLSDGSELTFDGIERIEW
ncbi:MAG: calcium-binding protein, partial [Gammaproteobacteria bacterium]|nr:calcium-binding protein [Gammaproteobacteria bacterium]